MSARILVVERYAELLSAILATLERRHIDCDAADGPADAIRMLNARDYETVLLSPTLPIREDPVIRYLHEHHSRARIILMTDGLEDTEECRILVKPFTVEELLTEID